MPLPQVPLIADVALSNPLFVAGGLFALAIVLTIIKGLLALAKKAAVVGAVVLGLLYLGRRFFPEVVSSITTLV